MILQQGKVLFQTVVFLGKVKKRRYATGLNLVINRSANYRVIGAVNDVIKQAFMLELREKQKNIGAFSYIHFYYFSKRRFDLDNYASYHRKLFLDCLVDAGIIPDDSKAYVKALYDTVLESSHAQFETFKNFESVTAATDCEFIFYQIVRT